VAFVVTSYGREPGETAHAKEPLYTFDIRFGDAGIVEESRTAFNQAASALYQHQHDMHAVLS
jgi:hypothetical protein